MRYLALIALLHCLAPVQLYSAEITPEENALIGAEVRKLYKLRTKAESLSSEAVSKVTNAKVYSVKVTIAGPDGETSEKIKFVKDGDAFSTITRPSTNEKCPELKALIKKDFRLKTEEDAKALEAALDALYPLSEHFGGKDKKAKAIRRTANSVTFVRGEFFKDFKGYVFETDDNGAIVEVRYSLGIKAVNATGK
ncbi:MAG: hypothetical protein ACI8W8_005051 [Rhodothermales bacterium]|jgi:hypothetical protein